MRIYFYVFSSYFYIYWVDKWPLILSLPLHINRVGITLELESLEGHGSSCWHQHCPELEQPPIKGTPISEITAAGCPTGLPNAWTMYPVVQLCKYTKQFLRNCAGCLHWESIIMWPVYFRRWDLFTNDISIKCNACISKYFHINSGM